MLYLHIDNLRVENCTENANSEHCIDMQMCRCMDRKLNFKHNCERCLV